MDTNVLVYAHDRGAGTKRSRAIDLIEELTTARTGAISMQVLQEFYVTVTGKLQPSMPRREAAAIVADLAGMTLHTPGAADVIAAVEMHQRLRLSFWDAMVVRSAIQLGCATLWSEDMASGASYDGLTVTNPFSSNK